MAELFLPIRFKTNVQLNASEIYGNGGIAERLLQKLRGQLEGVCSRHGYIRKGSLEIVRRSMGTCVKQHFNGHIHFELVCKGEICNPAKGTVVEAIVRLKNTLGIHAESADAKDETPILDIIIPSRSAGITSQVSLESLAIGDRVFVEILGKRYQMRDQKISIIGRAVAKPKVKATARGETEIPDPLALDGEDVAGDADVDADDLDPDADADVDAESYEGGSDVEGASDDETGRRIIEDVDEEDVDEDDSRHVDVEEDEEVDLEEEDLEDDLEEEKEESMYGDDE